MYQRNLSQVRTRRAHYQWCSAELFSKGSSGVLLWFLWRAFQWFASLITNKSCSQCIVQLSHKVQTNPAAAWWIRDTSAPQYSAARKKWLTKCIIYVIPAYVYRLLCRPTHSACRGYLVRSLREIKMHSLHASDLWLKNGMKIIFTSSRYACSQKYVIKG